MNTESHFDAYAAWIAASDAATEAEFALLTCRAADKAAAEAKVRPLWAIADAAHDAWREAQALDDSKRGDDSEDGDDCQPDEAQEWASFDPDC